VTVETTENIEEKIETIGAFLKQARVKKNITLNKVSDDLCIRKIYIQAIEDNNHKDLPPVPYGVGFVRSYAKYLGLNVERVVQLYKDEAVGDEEKIEIFEPQDEITYPSKQYIIGGIITALVVYLLYVIISGISGKNTEEQIPVVLVEDVEIEEPDAAELEQENVLKAVAQKIAEKEIETTEPVAEDEAAAETEEQNQAESIVPKSRVFIKITGETWLQVKGTEQTYFAKLVNEGFEFEVPDERGIVVTIGRPYFADVYIDGELKVFTTERKTIHIDVDKYLNKKHH